MDELFMRCCYISAERAAAWLRESGQQSEHSDVAADNSSGRHPEQVRQGAVQAQHTASWVVDNHEIRNRVHIFNPLLARPLYTREELQVFQCNRSIPGQCLEELALVRGELSL